jgi:hypothetical protein
MTRLHGAKPYGTKKVDIKLSKAEAVKIATSNLFNLGVPDFNPDSITNLLFQDIGGQEIVNIARHDSVNGINLNYQPIKNIGTLASQANSLNLISLQGTDKSYFEEFPISLTDHIPDVGNGANGSIVYFDSTDQNLIINVVNIDGYQVEVQFLSAYSIKSDTIYP